MKIQIGNRWYLYILKRYSGSPGEGGKIEPDPILDHLLDQQQLLPFTLLTCKYHKIFLISKCFCR